MFDFSTAAVTHSIPLPELIQSMVSAGWDIDKMRGWSTSDEHDFIARVTGEYASKYAALRAKMIARQEAAKAQRLAGLTASARARPDLICGRCDGKGKVRGFSHVANGTCFACAGKGVRGRRA